MGMTKMLPEMTYSDYSAVYNSLSFCMAAMGASTVYFFVHIHMVQKQFRTALCITGLVTLIAFYHYFRIFNSWTEAYEFLPLKRLATGEIDPSITDYSPHLTGQPFNDAYRYMDWLLTVPMLLIELILVMGLDAATTTSTCWRLGYSISDVISKCGVGLMITKIAMLKSRGSADSLIQGGGGGGSESYLPAWEGAPLLGSPAGMRNRPTA